jgi:hypothetical protein
MTSIITKLFSFSIFLLSLAVFLTAATRGRRSSSSAGRHLLQREEGAKPASSTPSPVGFCNNVSCHPLQVCCCSAGGCTDLGTDDNCSECGDSCNGYQGYHCLDKQCAKVPVKPPPSDYANLLNPEDRYNP